MKRSKKTGPSTQPRKQRLAMYTASLTERRRRIAAHLSDELMEKYQRRSMPLRKGDAIKVVRGDFKGTSSEVLRVDRKRYLIEAEGVTVRKADGTEVVRPIHPSNVIITKLDLSDPKRRAMLERKKGVQVEADAPKPKPKPKPAEKPAEAKANPETTEEGSA